MGKLLRVLVVFLLLFSVASLVLGILLFNKRELLIGRTQKLERAIIALATTVEAEGAEEQVVAYPSKDVSECTSELLDVPERSTFWDTYQAHLEEQDLPKLDLTPRKIQLMQYYRIDPVTLKPVLDPASGLKMTSGEGTMQEVLDDLLAKSAGQLGRLGATRSQLTALREELVRTISELNERKASLRQRLNDIVQLKDRISQLENDVRRLEGDVAALKDEKRMLEAQVNDLETQVAGLEEKNADLEERNKVLNKEIADLRKGVDQFKKPGDQSGDTVIDLHNLEHGVKGGIASVNPKWNFVVLNLNDDFIADLIGDSDGGAISPVELFVKRPGAAEEFVTKVRLIQVKKSTKLGVADILADWQQMPVKEGDVVFY